MEVGADRVQERLDGLQPGTTYTIRLQPQFADSRTGAASEIQMNTSSFASFMLL